MNDNENKIAVMEAHMASSEAAYFSVAPPYVDKEKIFDFAYRNGWNACAELMQKRIDELELQLSIEKGTKAWADVKNSSQWVDELRGGSDE